MMRYCVDVFMGTCKMLITFLLVFGLVGGGKGGISPFSCFVYIDFSVLM